MRNTKEKIISLLLAFLMVLTSMPVEGIAITTLAAQTEAAAADDTEEDDTQEDDSADEPSSDDVETTSPTAAGLIDADSNDPAAIPAVASEELIDEVTINSVEELVDLWKKGAEAYQNAVITIAPTGDAMDLTETDFNGLGSEQYPFQGRIVFSGSVSGSITLNCALFQYLSQKAAVGTAASPINLEAADNMTAVLLAEHYVGEEGGAAGNVRIQISAGTTSDDDSTVEYSTFGGIIGTMGEGASLSLTVTNRIAGGYAKVSGTGNRGFFCNTMEAGASLTITSYTGSTDYEVYTDSGHAGGLVGQMGAGAALTLLQTYSYSGNVTGGASAGGLVGTAGDGAVLELQGDYAVSGTITAASSGNAGGLLGKGTNTSFQIADGKTVTVTSAISGSYASGGLAGSYTFLEKDADAANSKQWNLAPLIVKGVTFATGSYAGGVFGVLENASTEQELKITDSDKGNGHISSTGAGVSNFGGLIGFYTSASLTDTLALEGVTISSTYTSGKTTYGGVIGVVDKTKNSYVTFQDLQVKADGSGASAGYFGGLVALCEGASMFDVGSVTIAGSMKSAASASCVYGGLIGALTQGVLRLHGITDISGIKSGGISPKFGQIVGTRTNALIYALGNGSDGLSGNENGWTLIRDGSGQSVSDVGTWGEVVRIDGTILKENKVTDSAHQTTDTEHLLVFNTEAHTVTIAGFYDYGDQRGHIYSTQNFAAIALSYQCGGAADTSGALRYAVSDVSEKWWIYLEADVDLTGTGITGFQRDDGSLAAFAGKLDGQGHSITMAAGETYGMLSGGKADQEGCGQIYNHRYLGLFAKTGEMIGSNGISNLTVKGSMVFGNTGSTFSSNTGDVKCGGITANQLGKTASYVNVTSSVNIQYANGSLTQSMPMIYVGGMIGQVSSGAKLTFSGCTWDGVIQDDCTAWDYYLGGYIGLFSDNGEAQITVTDCAIKGQIKGTNRCNNSRMGGFLAATEASGNKKLTITATNLTIQNLRMENGAVQTSGGLLGYLWNNVDFIVSGLKVEDSSLTAKSAGFGGLVYQASGYWKVYDSGISFSGNNVFNAKTVNETPSALLVCRGDDVNAKNLALYMEIGPNAYKLKAQPTITLSGGSYFDEIVGITINSSGNGVVSVATDASYALLDRNDCSTYQSQLSKSYDNPHTRYYYNLDSYRLKDGKVWADSTIESGKELLCWSVGQYCETNLSGYFTTSRGGNVSIKGTIDLTGLSYYPVDYTGTVDIQDASITFDYEQLETTEKTAGNKQLSNKNRQHYMMQTGLFLTLTSTTSAPSSMTIGGDKGLTLSGTIGQLAASDYAGGSGALICGKANGAISGTTLRTFTFSVDSSSQLVLDQLRVYSEDGLDAYAPLLINQIGSYSALSVVGVCTENYTAGTKAATSLIGNVGAETDQSIVLLFENMDLDGRSADSIFTNATFLESFSYDVSDMTSSGTYNFRQGSVFTFGKELSNGVNGKGSTGRNPYNEEEGTGQVWYENTIGHTDSEGYVTDTRTGVSAVTENGFFTTLYLPYVHVPEGGAAGSVSWKHELDVNQLVVDILEGCGTYDDPYIIDTEGQLETLGKFLSTGTIAGWSLNIPYHIASASGTASLETHTEKTVTHYSYTSGSTWSTADAEKATLTSAQVRTYLRNAYYMVKTDLTLKSNFYGLGGTDSSTNVFCGVIVGQKDDGTAPTITIRTHTSTNHSYFGGLIAYSGGSVVKNIILDYSGEEDDGVTLTLTAKASSQERADQTFFGGVIGYIVGGDNIIDQVRVTGLDKLDLIINGTDGRADGAHAKLTPVGAYVGLVGGNATSGGGVIFRSMDGSAGFSGDDYLENSDYYYRNPYVGRVLDGYALAEDCTVDNTNKNYSIPSLASNAASMEITSSAIKITSAQQLWVLSAIVNSGAGDMNGSGAYNSDAYKLGRVRTGTYDRVGQTAKDRDLDDCKYWGGIAVTSSDKISYLVYKYAENGAYLSGGSRSYSLSFEADCDMSSYGNGFRGIGASYQDNTSSDILRRTIYLGGTVDAGTGTAVITLKRTLKEYAEERGTDGSLGWWTQGLGLFPVVNFNKATTVKNLTIRGTISVSYPDDEDAAGEAAAGGFAGLTACSSGTAAVTFQNVSLGGTTDEQALHISGAKYCGGVMGVVGQPSRVQTLNGSSSLKDVSTVVGNYTFDGCSYSKLDVAGGYTAGGLIGLYRNSGKTLTVKGTSAFSDSEIGWVRDACQELYQATGNSTDASENAFSGAGGLVGFYSGGTCTVGASSEYYTVTFEDMRIYGPRIASNSNYGLGCLTGTMGGGGITAAGIKADNVTVEIDLTIAYQSVKEKDSSYYTTPAAGMLVGYGKGGAITLKTFLIENSRVLNAGYVGGVVGITNNSSGNVSIADAKLCDVVVYTKGAATFDGSAKAGGITGNNTKTLSVSNVSMEKVTVIADGKVGLINAYTRSSSALQVSNFSAVSCIAATTQNTSAGYFLGSNTNPGTNSASKGTDQTAGAAGIFIGACGGSGNGQYSTDLQELTAFNVRITDCIVGYFTGDADALSYTMDGDHWSFGEQTPSAQNIGVYTGKDSGIAYANLTGTEQSTYTDGKLGLLIGGVRGLASGGKLQIVGLSVQGSCYPFEENGYDNKGIDNSENSYVIYADYTGVSASEQKNTTGTVSKDYTSGYTESIAAPYVVVNAASSLTVYAGETGNSGRALLTGDSMVRAVIDRILADAAGNKDDVQNRIYNRIEDAAAQFSDGGQYVDNLMGYFEASESDKSANGYAGNLTDFPVLLVDSGRSADITAMVNAYVSVLTGCDQTGTGGAAARYTTIVPNTYQWNETAHRFVKTASASLSYNSTTQTLSVVGSLHDNQNHQFTLLDVYYKNPNADQGYHLYIPVVVKRVLQVDFSVKMLTGSSTYASIYRTNSALLASYGENYTTQLTYSYTWTAAEWNAYISGGGNLLWSYDKQVQLDTGIDDGDSVSDLKKSSTRLTLVDPNRSGPGDTYFIGSGTVLTQDADSDSVLEFKNLDGYTSVPLCDLLNLSVTEDPNGTLKVTGTGSASDEVPEGSSIRVWNGSSFTYYGTKSSSDDADTRYYTLSLVDEDQKAYDEGADVTISEIYYLTVNCTEGSGVHARLLSLGENRLTSTDANALPTRTKSSGSRYYTLGDFYEISGTDIETSSENSTPVVELTDNDYIDVKVSASVSVSADQAEDFKNYASGVNSYFRFAVRLNDGSSISPIAAASIAVEHLKIGDRELTASDYTGVLSGGVYYLTITSQAASAYQNQTVTATIRFSYEDDPEGISEQFPERTGDEDLAGVNFSVDAAIAYSLENIDGSSMSGSDSDGTKYHREKIEVVSITYNSYNTASEDGNTSQLGINGREVSGSNGQIITSLGMYNATKISSFNLTDKTSEQYPAKLVCTLTLEKKTDQADGTVKYEQVDLETYLTDLTIRSAGQQVSGTARNGVYAFTVSLTEEQINNLSTEQVELDLSYLVKSDQALEAIGDVGQYANYRVTLTAHLANSAGTALVEDVSDYLIYTNAKFYLGIIGTTDFDN